MTIRHLRIFAAVVDCGTMHAAAQKLYLSQPTITQAVKELEEHYGCLLFERYGRRLMITPAGQELLGHARELLGVYERMEQSMKQQAGQKLLRIGATVILAEQLLVPLVRAFEGQNPEVRVEVLVDNSSVLESRLLSGELDAALLDAAGRSGEIQLRPFLREELSVAAAAVLSPGPVSGAGDSPAAGRVRLHHAGGGQYAPAASGSVPGTVRPDPTDQVVLHQSAHSGAGGKGGHGGIGALAGADAGGTGGRHPAGDPGGGLCRNPGDLGGSAPGPERLCSPGAFSGLLSGTVRPVLSPAFIRIKTNNAKKPRADPGFFVCCHETDVLGKNLLKTHCVSPINLL